MLIARLIAEPDTLSASLEAAVAQMESGSVRVASAAMLDFCDVTLQIASPDNDAAVLRAAIETQFSPCDALIARAEPQVPHVFVSDMDSTMIGQECIDELADFAGIKPQIAAITERAMSGELDFESALRERVGLLAGLDEEAIRQCLDEQIRPVEGAQTLVATLKAKGCRTVLVTGGFHHFADPVAEMLGFDAVVANRLEISAGKLTGGLIGPIVNSATKRDTLMAEMARLGEGAVSLATGDGANDVPMFEAATYAIAYRAKPVARAAANGWIDRGDLTGVLRLLGIAERDWVKG